MTTTTVVFLDLSRFTSLTDVHGDDTAVDVIDRFLHAVDAATGPSGTLVKTLGDGVLLTFDDPATALRAADATNHRLHDLDGMPELTGGVTTGPVIDRDGDVFGTTVNLAARLADLAPPGELRVDQPTARAAADDGWQVEPLGPVEVRGLHEPRPVFRVLLCHPDHCVTDPVCGMRITPGLSTPTLTRNQEQFWFCSDTCRHRYAQSGEKVGDAAAGRGGRWRRRSGGLRGPRAGRRTIDRS